MSDLYFEDLRLGDKLPAFETTITQEIIDKTALAHFDFNPLHTKPEWASRAQVLGTPLTVIHGMFTLSQMASVITRAWGKSGAVITNMESKFVKPVPVGQTVRYEASVWESHPRHDGKSWVVISAKATDADGDVVAVAKFNVQTPSRCQSGGTDRQETDG
jgi:acyl dehydratase